MAELGVPLQGAVLYDGSGLSRDNRLDPATLVAVLRLAASDDHPELRPVLTGLPVAGFTGSLEYRFADAAPPARGRVRAKTGTLTGVSALAGVATDLDGTSVAFVLVADRVALVKTLAARDALDAAAAAIAGCHCSVRPGRFGGIERPERPRMPWSTGSSRSPSGRGSRARGPRSAGTRPPRSSPSCAPMPPAPPAWSATSPGLVADDATAPLFVVDRPGWIRANTESFDTAADPGVRQADREEGAAHRDSAGPSARG